MEDWQQWQLRADQIAVDLGREVDALQTEFFEENDGPDVRRFWPRFRDLKERVRTAPAIRLEDKLALERRLRNLGSRAYKAQEAIFARSSERKSELMPQVEALRAAAERIQSPRDLRRVRRDLDHVRQQFDGDVPLSPADRQSLWDAWREASQFVWDRLTGVWEKNEDVLRQILAEARQNLSAGDTSSAVRGIGRFQDALKGYEGRQEVVADLRKEADELGAAAKEAEERRAASRTVNTSNPKPAPQEGWRSDLERNNEMIDRLRGEIDELSEQVSSSKSILDQAVIRGNLVEKRRKVVELERVNKSLMQRLEQSEETPLITTG